MPIFRSRLGSWGAQLPTWETTNRWAREARGVDELTGENFGTEIRREDPLILDTILLEKVVFRANIKLLFLNTACHDLSKKVTILFPVYSAFPVPKNSTEYCGQREIFCRRDR